MLFFIDTKTHKIHTEECQNFRKYHNSSLALHSKFKFYLGPHKNLESAMLMAISKGYINASIPSSCSASCCCTSLEW